MDETYLKYIYPSILEGIQHDIENGELYEALVRNIEFTNTHGVKMFMDAYKSWQVNGWVWTMYYRRKGLGHYDFLFTDEDGKMDTTGKFKKAMLYPFSGFIMALKLFIQEHIDMKTFEFSAVLDELPRISLYRRAVKIIEKELNVKLVGEESDKYNVAFFFEVVNNDR